MAKHRKLKAKAARPSSSLKDVLAENAAAETLDPATCSDEDVHHPKGLAGRSFFKKRSEQRKAIKAEVTKLKRLREKLRAKIPAEREQKKKVNLQIKKLMETAQTLSAKTQDEKPDDSAVASMDLD